MASAAVAGVAAVGPVGRGVGALAEQGIKFTGHPFTHFTQAVKQSTTHAVAGQAQAARRPFQIAVLCGQQVGLLVVQVLDAVLNAAQEGVGVAQRSGSGLRHQTQMHQTLECRQGRPCAQFGVLATAHHLHELHDEFNLANAAARQLHVIGTLGAPGGAALGFVADLAVQLAQTFEHTVVQVAAKNKGLDQRAQRQRAPTGHGRVRRHHAALQPGKTLPLTALHLKIIFQHGQAGHWRAGIAIGAQGEVHPEDKAIFSGVANQRVKALGDKGKVFVR